MIMNIPFRYRLYLTIYAHHVVIIFMTLGPFLLPVLTSIPYFFVVLLGALGWYIALRKVPCFITEYENKLRKKIGLPKIKTFIQHYYLADFCSFSKAKKKEK